MQIRQADKHMQTSLHGIAKRAKVAPGHRFGNLFSLLNEENLHWCFPELNKKAILPVSRSFQSVSTEICTRSRCC
jgi:hypothetical protein